MYTGLEEVKPEALEGVSIYAVNAGAKTIYFQRSDGTFQEQRTKLLDVDAFDFYVQAAKDKLNLEEPGIVDRMLTIVDLSNNDEVMVPPGGKPTPTMKPMIKVRFDELTW